MSSSPVVSALAPDPGPPAAASRGGGILRDAGAGHTRVGFAELFFDLVFVFAITQVSHHLLAHLDARHAVEAAVLLLGLWWVWIYTSWATNWLDPERAPTRLLLAFVMVGSLVMAAAVPDAFGAGGLAFALAYVIVQLGRNLMVARALSGRLHVPARTLGRASLWTAASGLLWLAGGIDDPTRRGAWWIAALAVDYAAPALGYWLPGRGRIPTGDWVVAGDHMAERCGLFVIIALGEGIILTGATFAEAGLSPGSMAAMLVAFVGSFAMWWVYFDVGARRGADHIAGHADAGRVARDAFTYGHWPIVAGIVVVAVTDEMLLAHPGDPADPAFGWTLVAGAGLFLAGTAAFKRASSPTGWWPLSHIVGLAGLALAAWPLTAGGMTRLAAAALVAALLVLVAVWEWRSFHGGWRRAEG